MNPTTTTKPTLVLGGTGKTGTRVAGAAAGVPAEEIGPLTELFGRVLDGRNAYVAHDVDDVLGRPARDFGDYARTTAATSVWTPQLQENLR